jgi:hypothetical protein
MRKKIFSTFIVFILFIIIDFIFFKINIHFGKRQLPIIYFILSSVFIFILLENLIYNKLFNFKSSKLKIIIFIISPLLISMIFADRLQEIDKYYFFSKNFSIRDNKLWEADNLLGWKGIPNTHGSYDHKFGDNIKFSIPVIFDSISCRAVPDSLKLKSDTLDLYLGCSFTIGASILAQNSYPYLTSKLLNHNYINAAIGGYGLGQMVQQVRSLTKQYKIKYVFIQLSPWLAGRAMNLLGPAYHAYRPCPYFSDLRDSFKLNLPAFTSLWYTFRNWRNTKPSYYERMQFILSDGINMEILDYFSYQFALLKTKIGIIPKPTKRKNELEKYVYDYMIDVCKKNNSIPILVKIGYNHPFFPQSYDNSKILMDYFKRKAKIIDLDLALQQKVDVESKSFKDLFYLGYTNHNRIIRYDAHPNEYANKLFSDRIYYKLKKK